MSREVEGLPWPEGDPDGLRQIAGHAAALAGELEARQGHLSTFDPVGWLGAGRDSFTVTLLANSHALGAGASAMHHAFTVLTTLANTVETAQHDVLEAARKLKDARDAAAQAQAKAVQARIDADQAASMSNVFAPFPGVGPDPFAQAAESDARAAENAAATAQTHALDVERWAQHKAQTAVHDVEREDRATAHTLEADGLVQAPGSSALVCAAPSPAQPLAALGNLLLGSDSATHGTLVDLLSRPPAPPPPPPKPTETHHNWWKLAGAGGLAVVTVGLTVVDAVQFGADPLTDGATVVVGEETAALGTDAIAGEVVAGEAAADTVVAESAADVIAAEGDPAAGLVVEEGATDAAVEDASLPAERPSWRDTETDVTDRYADQGYREQVSFKDGEEVKYGTKGSSRPELYKPGSSVEAKNYDVTTSAGRSRLIRNVTGQAKQRLANLPEGTTQSLTVDVRGQAVTPETLDELASRIASRSGGAIDMDDIIFIR
jgi:type VII secretion system ESX-1 substrate